MQNQNAQIMFKRARIIGGYLAFFAAAAFLLWYFITPAASCFDRKQNQSEKGIDCGGTCAPCREIARTKDISVEHTAFAPGGNNTYDVVAKISNPNDAVGAQTFDYVFTLKDAAGAVIAVREGEGFILPSDTRYVAQLGLETAAGAIPAAVEIAISDARWSAAPNFSKPQIGVYSKKFGAAEVGSGSEAEGIIRNESSYDLKEVGIVIVLRDEKGRIVGINTTQRNSVRAREQQGFHVSWPYPLGAQVQKMEVDPQTNVFEL